jgi:hypothetical protein
MNELMLVLLIMFGLSFGGVLAIAIYEYIKHGNFTK